MSEADPEIIIFAVAAGRDGRGRWPEGLEGQGADLGWGWRQVRTARRKQASK